MYWRDHAPPHFHAKYQGDEVTVEISTGEVTGNMNRRALALVEEWRVLHLAELEENWARAMEKRSINRIAPLEQDMFLHVTEAHYVRDYVVWLRFNDGASGEVDLRDELEGEVFGALLDVEQFRDFRVDPEIETLVWENGADFAPEFLHERLKVD